MVDATQHTSLEVEPSLGDNATPKRTQESYERQIQVFFQSLIDQKENRFHSIELEANRIRDLLPGEKLYLRWIENDFDGVEIKRWCFLHKKSPHVRHANEISVAFKCERKAQGLVVKTGRTIAEQPNMTHIRLLRELVHVWRVGVVKAHQEDVLQAEADKKQIRDAMHEKSADKFEDVTNILERQQGATTSGKYFGPGMPRIASSAWSKDAAAMAAQEAVVRHRRGQ